MKNVLGFIIGLAAALATVYVFDSIFNPGVVVSSLFGAAVGLGFVYTSHTLRRFDVEKGN